MLERRRTRCLGFSAALLVLVAGLPLRAGSGKVDLARKYHPGEKTVYQTRMQTRVVVRSNPSGLEAFLPPMPSRFATLQENTVTVRAVHADGAADVENRFDRFEIQSDLPDRFPDEVKNSAAEAQAEFARRMTGRTLAVHYDPQGRLLAFEGAEDILEQLDSPLREPMQEVLRLFLEQMSGNALSPGHRVGRGEQWSRKLSAPPSDARPFDLEGESIIQFSGKTRHGREKAAEMDYHFTQVLTPQLERLRRAGPLALLEAQGMQMDLRVDGRGQGRVLLSLKNGRVLRNHSTIHEVLTARLLAPGGTLSTSPDPITLEIESETQLEVDESGGR